MPDASVRSFLESDLKVLSTDVLKLVQRAILDELRARRQENDVARRAEMVLEKDCRQMFKALPAPHHSYSKHWLRYLDELLEQDWSHLFSGGDPEPKYYVYLHCAPSGNGIRYVGPHAVLRTAGLPFYVGKGTGNRAYDMNRNQGHGATLRALLERHKQSDIVAIAKDGLSEARALELESKLIYFFGTKYEKGRKGLLVNLDIPPRPF